MEELGIGLPSFTSEDLVESGSRLIVASASCLKEALPSTPSRPGLLQWKTIRCSMLGEARHSIWWVRLRLMLRLWMAGPSAEGGVALLRNIKNPIRAARIVMDKTDHVLIAGEAARKLALANGLAKSDLRVPNRVKAWKEGLRKLKSNRFSYLSETSPEILQHFLAQTSDTVGALARDNSGNLAAACSTGGVSLKLPGRIGDSAILGAGLYADNKSGAATATGIGEQAMRLVVSKAACDLMSRTNAVSAATQVIRYSTRTLGMGTGLIALDRHGRYAIAHNTRNLYWAATTVDRTTASMFVARVKG